MTITPEQISSHGLSDAEYKKIVSLIGRDPNLVELGIFSVMWSEHCSYKSSRKHLKGFPTSAPWVIQGPGENAGVIDIGDGDAAIFKMESHNHPSFIEPYQGAATGVGGILRDVFTMGARPIANLNSLRFGSPKNARTASLVKGVVAGIGGYGNCMGIPTVGGEVAFDESYDGNILVNAMTVGLAKKDKIFYGKAAGVGNPVIYVGAKTGRDGIHGATMASGSFDDTAEQKRPTVQVGDPFMEKLLLEACLELMATDAIVGIQDMGAAGLTSSSIEMAGRAGNGLELNLDKVPQRETGMTPYEILLSESQERMLLVVTKGRESEVERIFKKWDLDAAVIGQVTDTGRYVIKFHNEIAADLPVEPLAGEAPIYERPVKRPADLDEITKPVELPEPKDWSALAKNILAMPGIASKRWVWRQYDSMVMSGTVAGPGSDAALVRIGDSNKAIAISVDCNSRYVYLDPSRGAQIAVAESGRNVVCSGATPLAITDCLNFGNPEKPETMWQFAEACKGLATACRELNTPVVSGNVSLYNETNDQGIFPTPSVGMVGVLKDLKKKLSGAFCEVGDVILLLGETLDEIGGSAYVKLTTGKTLGACPSLDLVREKLLWQVLRDLNDAKRLRSAHDVSEGGLLVTLCESAFAGNVGFRIEVESPLRADTYLLGESQSRVVVSLPRAEVAKVLPMLKSCGLPFSFLGDVIADKAVVRYNGENILDENISALRETFENGFEKAVFKSA